MKVDEEDKPEDEPDDEPQVYDVIDPKSLDVTADYSYLIDLRNIYDY